jgi:drug/metabolite transporter (DMT)-like permease
VDIPAWIPITVAAAVFQVWRTALQARLRESLSASGAGFVRYLYALPLDLAMLLLAWTWLRVELPALSPEFLLLCLLGGLAQIITTVLLISAFGMRNFVVGTAYAKTEAAQLVVISVVVLGVSLPPLAVAGILLSVVGVLLLSFAGRRMTPGELLRATLQPAALYGLGSGLCFAITGLALREASLTLPDALPVLFKALLILLVTNVLQTLMQGGYMAWRQRPQLAACLHAWRRAAPVGALSALGSAAWFAGFALTHVALVRGLGQIEVLFTFLVGRFYLHERVRTGEALALVVVAFGVVMIAASEMV